MKEDLFDELLDEIKPSTDEVISRKMPHKNFSKSIVFLAIKSRTEDFFYEKDFRNFIKVSKSRSFIILDEMVDIGILRKTRTGGLVEYWFEIDKQLQVPIVQKYFDKARNVLGLTLRLKPLKNPPMGGDRKNLF